MINEANTLTEIAKFVGAQIKLIRIRREFTQQELAALTGLHRGTIAAIEKGEQCEYYSFLRILKALKYIHLLNQLEQFIVLPPDKLDKIEKIKKQSTTKRVRKNKK